jgi:hypothetical protein
MARPSKLERTWSDAQLMDVVADSSNWRNVMRKLGLNATVVVGRRPYSSGNRERRIPYDPESIDLFFIVDGDLTIYLTPSRIIAGRVAILLHTYTNYIVGSAAGLMAPSAAVA